ncbi:hypothetical protein KFE25_013255 [Diacronema lutheri]|uniref:Uncharacterized protein n=1 Tax=Diacronema lutheri TaxID=2081491 RepID=A0A8J6CAZ4_DIALT|nr:hypothetical protein KFE25_013255 [Diacronema lutheri]
MLRGAARCRATRAVRAGVRVPVLAAPRRGSARPALRAAGLSAPRVLCIRAALTNLGGISAASGLVSSALHTLGDGDDAESC